jgi:hypothetical protein
MILMCKDAPVYDIEKGQAINEALMPGAMLKGMSYESWARHRKSVLSNAVARKAYFTAFGYAPEDAAERKTHTLSLSDCYWRKYENEAVTFEQISPYCADFWDGTGRYQGGAIPTIYTSGVISKYWIDRDRLYKKGCFVELEAYKLAVSLGIPCNKIERSQDETGIVVHNITSSDVMLEPAICSGRFSGTFFPTIDEVVGCFGETGLTMLAFDAIVGNTDRHLENFGFLRDANTGEYLGMAPLYDFDHTLSADGVDDYLIEQLPKSHVVERICSRVPELSMHPVFRARAQAILNTGR